MNEEDIKKRIVDYARKNNAMLFSEIEWIFDECNFDYRGNLSMRWGSSLNVVFWEGWNKHSFDMILDLVKKGTLKHSMALRSATTNYILDGKTLDYPLVKNGVPKYETLHWCPSTFEPVQQTNRTA